VLSSMTQSYGKRLESPFKRGVIKVTDDREILFGDNQDARIIYDAANDELTIQTLVSGTFTDFIKIKSGEATLQMGLYGVTPVVQATKISDPSGGGTIDAESRTAINAIIDALEGLGVSASV